MRTNFVYGGYANYSKSSVFVGMNETHLQDLLQIKYNEFLYTKQHEIITMFIHYSIKYVYTFNCTLYIEIKLNLDK